MNNFMIILISISYLFLITTYYKLNNISFLDKMSRSELNRFEPIKTKGDIRLVKGFIAITLTSGLHLSETLFNPLATTSITGLTVLLIWYQCYDIFKGISGAEYLFMKNWVDKRGNLENRIKMYLKSIKESQSE